VISSAVDILLVDDDDDLRMALGELLGEYGYRVALAENGAVALDYLVHNPVPRVILLDLMMPVMNGVRLSRELLERPELQDVPILLLTAAGDPESYAGSVRAARVFRKPLDIPQLLMALIGLVGR